MSREPRLAETLTGHDVVNSMRGILLFNERMSQYTRWRVGGLADCLYKPASVDDLAQFLATLSPSESIFWLGLGSNLLIRDGGIRGTVILTAGLLDEIHLVSDTKLRVESGVFCAKVARFSAKKHLTGAEFLAGIPGTMGGALAMNAGAFAGETWDRVKSVETMDRHGQIHHRLPSDFQVSYRQVVMPAGEWFIAAQLQLSPGDAISSLAKIKGYLMARNISQPTQLASCGSVFRNPNNDFAGRLIEASGLKGLCVGGACVSEKHANFIINTGQASADDIEQLIDKVTMIVQRQHGVQLQTEVHRVGEATKRVSVE